MAPFGLTSAIPLVEHIAHIADEDCPRMVWMARDEDTGDTEDTEGVWWKHGSLIDRSTRWRPSKSPPVPPPMNP